MITETQTPVRSFLYALTAIDDEGFHLIRDRKSETVVGRDTFISWSAKGKIDPMSLVNYNLSQFQSTRTALRDAQAMLREVAADYNHPNFTDRRGAGPRINAVLESIQHALNRNP